MTKISVIVPFYNSSKYIRCCLDSLVNQTYKDLEIIFVNDGSMDDSEEIVKEYLTKYNNIFLYTITNHGQSYARNYGLSKASGEYIAFVDSDDYVDVDLFSSLSKKLKKKRFDILLFGYYAVDNNKNILFSKKYNCLNENNVSDVEYLMTDPCPWNKIYKKSFLDKVKFKLPVGIIYEDYAYIPTLIKHNPSIGYLDMELYYYVQSDSSTTRNDCYKEKYENLFEATELLYNSFVSESYKEEIEYLIYYHFLYLGSLNFYKYNKYELIDRISLFMNEKYPKWFKNKYVKKCGIKDRILAYLFYKRKYSFISLVQKVKGGFR